MTAAARRLVRCAIYTRVSTETGLDQDFNSLDANQARLPTPVPTKSGSMPTHERLGLNDLDDLQNRRKPSIQLDKEPAIAVREPGPPAK
jgi:hypothetical protein